MDRPRPETVPAGTDPTRPTPPLAPALAPVAAQSTALVLPGGWQIAGLPDIVLRAGPQAAERTVEFFTAQICNPHTRAAYAAAVTRFFTWCDARGLELTQISPIAVATYIENMHGRYRAPTIKQHLAAIRRLFDWLVTGQVIPTNPATSVRGPTHVVRTGKTRRWCADAGRPTRFKPSSPSPTDAVRDGSAKLGHPVQDVTREHGLTPLPR